MMPSTYIRWIPVIALVLSGLAIANRALTVTYRESEAPNAPIAGQMQLYGNSYALVIGIDQYTGGWPRLSMAVKDAEEVAAELRKRGFQVTFKSNLKSAELAATFKEFYALKGEDPEARLFVWYAGHGHTMGGEGFLVPADAPRPEFGGRFRLSALSMRRFGEFVRLAQSKHAYAVFDACFAGTVFTTQRAIPPAAITRATTLPVRQFLTSGDADQTVSDDGRFRKLFLRAIRGEERSDANGDGYITASELGMFLTDRLTNLTQSRQTPRSGKLRDENYDRGDFVFLASLTNPVAVVITKQADEIQFVPKPGSRQSFEPEMVRVTGGCYQMGSHGSDERQHQVCIEDFVIGKYEVTQGQWQAVLGNNPAEFRRGDNHPVEEVSWDDVQRYIQKLNAMTGKRYRLPTEAEWEYACRSGGKTQAYCGGADVKSLAWYQGFFSLRMHTFQVGTKSPNGLGLYDMSGNVSEWTCSNYSKTYDGAEQTCASQTSVVPRAHRGGAASSASVNTRSTSRNYLRPDLIAFYVGFRLAQDI